MDDEQTQPDTQPVIDPRRLGKQNSGLSNEDLSDVICILHPTTSAAFKAVLNTAKSAPQHVQPNEDLVRGWGRAELRNERASEHEASELGGDVGDGPKDHAAPDAPTIEEELFHWPRDLALRFSSKLKDPHAGFRFGRNAATNDIVLAQGEQLRRISNNHFRIYLNNDGILMLQDTSTNGTFVDGCPLKYRPNGNTPGAVGDFGQSRMLVSSSTITLMAHPNVPEEEVKFVVRVPGRGAFADAYTAKLQQHLDATREEEVLEPAMQPSNESTKLPARPQIIHGGPGLDITTPIEGAVKRPAIGRNARSYQKQFPKHWDGGDKYNIVGQVGKGAFATVYQVASKMDGTIFAAKELSKRQFMKNHMLDRKFDNEMQIMKSLRHPNIVEYIEYEENTHHMYIIMEFVPLGDLGAVIQKQGPMPEDEVKVMARQVFHALHYLHQQKITHRDIKPDNILIASENPLEVKLSDFGLSKVIDNQETALRTFCGTLLYCAPEVFSRYPDFLNGRPPKRRLRNTTNSQPHTYNQACDIWSFAAVLFTALSGYPPFTVETGDKDLMLEKIMTTKLDIEPLRRQQSSAEGVTFLQKLLNPRPDLRPTEVECLKDVWLADGPHATVMDVDLAVSHQHDGSDEVVLGASQLTLHEESSAIENGWNNEEEVHSDERLRGQTRSKRRKVYREAQNNNLVNSSSHETSYPTLLKASLGDNHDDATAWPNGNRLFGEIGQSALGSSGVLPHTHRNHLNLGIVTADKRRRALSKQTPSPLLFSPSTRHQSHDEGSNRTTSDQGTGGDRLSQQQAEAAASLDGAESLVGHLQVASPSPQRSPVTTPRTPLTPKTPKTREATPTHSTRTSHNDVEAETSSRKFVRRIELSIPDSYYYDVFDKSTHNAEYAAKMRAQGGEEKPAKTTAAKVNDPGGSVTGHTRKAESADSDTSNLRPPEEPQTYPPKNGAARLHQVDKNLSSATSSREQAKADEGPEPTVLPASPTQSEEFLRPLPVLGKLTSTPQSILNVTIPLNKRETSWGRGHANTIIHPNGHDVRIPKYALDILFWRAGLADEMKRGKSWLDVPEVPAVIKTRSSRPIYINGIELVHKDKDGNPYGKLYTGDVITVWSDGSKEMKFSCEFFHGASVDQRPAGGKAFDIEHADIDGTSMLKSSTKTRDASISNGPSRVSH